MGLDMYAYAVKQSLVTDDQVTDVPIGTLARRAVNFIDLTDDQLKAMSEDARAAYWNDREEAERKATEAGFINNDFAYWRKFNHLHGWMESLYRAKGGESEVFNCNNVRLSSDDIDRLESMASMKALAPARGFFFGADDPFSNDDRDEVLKFVANAREAMANGMVVFYDSWW